MSRAAFDYDNQRWVVGQQAGQIRAAQIKEELAILRSPRGAEYLRFCGVKVSLSQAVSTLEAELLVIESH